MVEDAEEKGLISPGVTTLVEPTSGNMGIGLAYIAVLRGYRFVAVMPAEYSLDKQILLRYLGAEVVLTGKGLQPQSSSAIVFFFYGMRIYIMMQGKRTDTHTYTSVYAKDTEGITSPTKLRRGPYETTNLQSSP